MLPGSEGGFGWLQTSFAFYLYGVSSSEAAQSYLSPIKDAGIEVKTFSYMDYESFLESLSEVAVGLHPVCLESPFSSGKSFGKILAYLSADVPVITSYAVDHQEFFDHGRNGVLAGARKEWIDCATTLLDNPQLRQSITDEAHKDLLAKLSTPAAARQIDLVLRELLTERNKYYDFARPES
jgi:glycosyltransferase involved in cell wall biosynthesis